MLPAIVRKPVKTRAHLLWRAVPSLTLSHNTFTNSSIRNLGMTNWARPSSKSSSNRSAFALCSSRKNILSRTFVSITTLPLSLATASDSANQFYTVGPAAMTAKHRCALGSNGLHAVEFRTSGPLGRTLFKPLDRLRVQGTPLGLSSPTHSFPETLGHVPCRY